MSNFDEAAKGTLKNEGGLAEKNNWDTGGITNFGISKKQYPHIDIRNLTQDEAVQIYHDDYWIKRGAYGFTNQKVANFALDTVIQHGQGPRILQNAAINLGADISPDNSLGPNTWNAINNLSPRSFLKEAIQERLKYLRSWAASANPPPPARALAGMERRIKSFFLPKKLIAITLVLSLLLAGFVYYRMQK